MIESNEMTSKVANTAGLELIVSTPATPEESHQLRNLVVWVWKLWNDRDFTIPLNTYLSCNASVGVNPTKKTFQLFASPSDVNDIEDIAPNRLYSIHDGLTFLICGVRITLNIEESGMSRLVKSSKPVNIKVLNKETRQVHDKINESNALDSVSIGGRIYPKALIKKAEWLVSEAGHEITEKRLLRAINSINEVNAAWENREPASDDSKSGVMIQIGPAKRK